ncbi:thymidylate kinase [Phymastichus coffea]|uniref:thymidylate kinase n=1 Tax=Phymastichus coffea TaxID=108790 RepID=UPI00273B404D|nr:thymidylate kinase [Phymastichus coffea]
MVRGAFIVMEGLDRAGKSTQVSMLLEALKKRNISTEKRVFPDRSTIIGGVINDYLLKKIEIAPKSVHLLFSANRWECEESICQTLKKGTTLVVDRYAASGAAYGAATTDHSLEWCKGLDRGLPAPDLVFYLDVPEEVQQTRASWGDERYERTETQRKVRANFQALAPCFRWSRVDATKSVEEMHQDVLERVLATIGECKDKLIGKLYES